MERTKNRNKLDRFESEETIFFEKIRKVYLERANNNPRFFIINAEKSLDDVNEQAITILKSFL